MGIAALILFVLAFLFHGFGFHPSPWLDAASMGWAGLACLTLHLLGIGPVPAIVQRRVVRAGQR